MRLLAMTALATAACAAPKPNLCPPGTTLASEASPIGRARYCQSNARLIDKVPVPGRTYRAALGFAAPTAPDGRLIEGPYTSWHADGTLASHGQFRIANGRSVPHGEWAFWYPSGLRQAHGHFEHGQPHGCFALWAEDGTPSTALVDGDTIDQRRCTPPDDSAIADLEAGRSSEREQSMTAQADIGLSGTYSGSDLGIENAASRFSDPEQRLALHARSRAHLGPFRLGLASGMRTSDANGYGAWQAAAVIGYALPRPHRRVEMELSVEAGLQRLTARPFRDDTGWPASDEVQFHTPLGVVQATGSFQAGHQVEFLLDVRAGGWPAREQSRATDYCFVLCDQRMVETWRVGGFAYSAGLGIRYLIR